VVIAPERHAQGAEIPEDRPRGRQPTRAEEDVVASEWEGVEIGGEVLSLNGEQCGAEDSRAGDAVTIGDRDTHAGLRLKDEVGAGRGLLCDEVVC
jgi:hypothetical protein